MPEVRCVLCLITVIDLILCRLNTRYDAVRLGGCIDFDVGLWQFLPHCKNHSYVNGQESSCREDIVQLTDSKQSGTIDNVAGCRSRTTEQLNLMLLTATYSP